MSRHRFYLPAEALRLPEVVFPAATAHQLRRVLRLRPGDVVTVFVGDGLEHVVRLRELRDDLASATVLETRPGRREPRVEVALYQALLSRERFEYALEKATEIGVHRLVPLLAERARERAASVGTERLDRWRRIAAEAAEQCGRCRVPEIAPPCDLAAALAADPDELLLLAWEHEQDRSLRAALAGARERGIARVRLLVGSEGGFSEPEVEQARASGAVTVSLGPRILRGETAGPLLAALVLYELGDMEPLA